MANHHKTVKQITEELLQKFPDSQILNDLNNHLIEYRNNPKKIPAELINRLSDSKLRFLFDKCIRYNKMFS